MLIDVDEIAGFGRMVVVVGTQSVREDAWTHTLIGTRHDPPHETLVGKHDSPVQQCYRPLEKQIRRHSH